MAKTSPKGAPAPAIPPGETLVDLCDWIDTASDVQLALLALSELIDLRQRGSMETLAHVSRCGLALLLKILCEELDISLHSAQTTARALLQQARDAQEL